MMSVYASMRPVEQSHTHNKYIPDTHAAVYCAAHIPLEYSICRKDKSRRGRLSFAQREGDTDRRRGVLPSFASAASLFYGPAEIYSPLLLFSPSLFFARMNGCTYTFTVELWPVKNPQQTQDDSHESSLSGFSFPAPPPQTKKTT